MRKIILSMLVLAGATTYAQVGINEESPKATLDISVKTDNINNEHLEGLLIPRVTKDKALKMANNTTTVLEESTLIYVNDLNFTNPSDGTEAKVADITGNGYYFWNGTKWVRQTGQDGEEWVYNPTNQRIELKRSGKGDFHNYVYYDNTTGQYVNTDTFENIEDVVFSLNSGGVVEQIVKNKSLLDLTGSKKINFSLSTNLSSKDETKTFLENRINIVPQDTNKSFIVNRFDAYLTSDNTNDYDRIFGSRANIKLMGTGNITSAIGSHGTIALGSSQNIKAYGVGVLGTTYIAGGGNINRLYGVEGRHIYYSAGTTVNESIAGYFLSSMSGEDNTLIKNNVGIGTKVHNNSKNAGQGDIMAGIQSSVVQTGQTKYKNIFGIVSSTSIGGSSVKPDNLYGLYIGDATGAETNNYAIFTNDGDIRFGGLADNSATDLRLVMTTNYGVLRATNTSLSDLESLWANDDANHLVKLKKTSTGADRTSTPGTTRNDVAITDEGKVLAKAFIGYNGASIFPDYVFEKYYKGYSNIKADYDFHNLASVESFVKKNGHLPGYKSAKEIAKEGLIDISATQLINIEKIEELYLHTIEQERKIEAKDAKIAELEARLERLEKLINK